MEGVAREKFWNVPNSLTLIRAALVPVFALLLLRGNAQGALLVFFTAGLTDVLDGLAARTWRQRTRIGTVLDPLADKLLLSTAFIILTSRSLGFSHVIPLWLTLVVIGRDFIILAGGLVIYRIRGIKEFPPTVAGKISTVFQVGTVFWVVLSNSIPVSAAERSSALATLTSSSVLDAFFISTLILTVISGAQYVLKGVHLTFFPAARTTR